MIIHNMIQTCSYVYVRVCIVKQIFFFYNEKTKKMNLVVNICYRTAVVLSRKAYIGFKKYISSFSFLLIRKMSD